MSAKKIISLPVRDQMFSALKEQILFNDLKPNDVLHIDKLAEEFGVSATPVREALVKLESDGLVTLIPNKGAKVSDISDDDILNTWEMRRLLESYAARSSISLITDEELDDLEKDILRLKNGEQDDDLYISTDIRLHELFFKHLKNDLLKDAIRRIHEISHRIRYFAERSVLMHEKVVQDVIQEHLTIIVNIRSRNTELLIPLLYTHLLNGEKRTLEAHKQAKSRQD